MVLALVDTSFLLDLLVGRYTPSRLQNEIEEMIDAPVRLCVLEAGLDEVFMKSRKLGRVAMQWVEANGVKVVESKGKPDELVLDFALKEKAVVCTNDKRLKKRLLEAKGLKVVGLKGSNLVV